MTDDPLETKFDIITVEHPREILPKEEFNNNMAIDDFTEARKKMLDILAVGSDAVAQLGNLAAGSQDSDHYMALSKLIKETSAAAGNLLELHKQLDLLKDRNDNVQTQEFHNHLHFTGSTADLSEALKKSRKE